jgi:transglutaminase-like putative cysteine protease
MWLVAGATLGFLLLFAVVFHNKYTFLVALAVLALYSLFLYLKWDDVAQEGGRLSNLLNEAGQAILFIRGYLPYEEKHGVIISVTVCAFMVFYMVLAVYVTFQFYFVALLGFGTFAVNWMMNYRRSDIGFAIFLFCFCVLILKKMNKKRVNRNAMALYMMPVCLVIVASSSLMPHGTQRWDSAKASEFLKDPMSAANDFFYFMFNPKYFSFQTTGFEGVNGRLGGNIALNNRKVMDVYTSRPTYLSGRIKDTYTGYSWINKDGAFDKPYDRDMARRELFETRLNLPYSQLDSSWPTSEMVPLTVQIGPNRTGTLFRPSKSLDVSIATTLDILTNDMGDLRVTDVLPANTSYTFNYLDVDYSSEDVKEILRQSRRGIYREAAENELYIEEYLSGSASGFFDWDSGGPPSSNLREIWAYWEVIYRVAQSSGNTSVMPSVYFESILAPYADYAYSAFLDVPETVPERVGNLARELTQGFSADFDKAKAIETYLVTYPYTLTPDTPPRDVDFVDYFLFEGKEGYCTYYASAMAILCRSIGLPARYMEGFILPNQSSGVGVYSVTNLQAHSWVEVYFEGFGWAPFEPTAPYSFGFNAVDTPIPSTLFTPEFAQNPYYSEYIEDMMGEDATYFRVPEVAPVQSSTQEGPDKRSVIIVFFAAAAFLAAAFGAMVLRGRVLIAAHESRLKRLPPNRQAAEIFKGIMRMATYCDYPIGRDETPYVYAQRVGKRFSFNSDMIFLKDLADIYYRARFAQGEIRSAELELLKNCKMEFLRLIKGAKSKWAFIWDRYVRRKF